MLRIPAQHHIYLYMKNNSIFEQWMDYRSKVNSNTDAISQKKQTVEDIVESLNKKLKTLEERPTEKSSPPIAVTGGETKTITFPQFRITENFGRRSGNESDLRAFLDTIRDNISGTNWIQKVKSLESILQQTCNEACAKSKGTANLISSLIFLDCIATVVYEFGSSTAGFIFESFMATLMGKMIRQVPAEEGHLLDIEHAKDPSKGLSLKLIAETTDVGGSYNALLDFYKKYGKGVPYLIVVKGAEGGENASTLSFNYINIYPQKEHMDSIARQEEPQIVPVSTRTTATKSPDNVVALPTPKVGQKTKIAEKLINEVDDSGISYYIQATDIKKTKKENVFQFNMTLSKILSSARQTAVLNFGDYNKLKERSAVLVEALQVDVMGAFENLNQLMSNLTLYFADAKGGAEKAKLAAQNANNILQILNEKPRKQ